MSEEKDVIKVELVKKPWYKRWWAITLFALIGLSALSSVISPSKEGTKSTAKPTAQEAPAASPAPVSEEKPDEPSELAVGKTFSGSVWAYTIYSFRETETINEKDNEFMVAEDKPDEKYVIVNFGIKNVTKKSQQFSSIISSYKIRAKDGLTFEPSWEESVYLKQPIAEGQISPGLENRGEIVFKVRNDATELKFDVSEESGAIWELK